MSLFLNWQTGCQKGSLPSPLAVKPPSGKNGRKIELRVAAYIRVSTDSRDQENSYESQSGYFARLLSSTPEILSAGIYSDYGISGTLGAGRTGFTRLLRHCEEGRIDCIVCKSVSRFARNTSDFITAMTRLKDCGVRVIFEKEGVDTLRYSGDFILTALAAVAQEESRSISLNVSWGLKKRFEAGQARNYDIYGYRYAADASFDQDGVRRVEIFEEEAKTVRRIFTLANEGVSLADIARGLNYEGVPAPIGKTVRLSDETTPSQDIGWTPKIISGIIRTERYCGDVILQKTYTPDFLSHRSVKNRGELPRYLALDHHPAIISRGQFAKAQELVILNRRLYTRENTLKRYPLSGRIICGSCGRRYNLLTNRSELVWWCPYSRLNYGKRVCHAVKITADELAVAIKTAVLERFLSAGEGIQ